MTNLHGRHARTSDIFCKLLTCMAFGGETSKMFTPETYEVYGDREGNCTIDLEGVDVED